MYRIQKPFELAQHEDNVNVIDMETAQLFPRVLLMIRSFVSPCPRAQRIVELLNLGIKDLP